MTTTAIPPLELWGGVECTLNRVGDRFFDQLEWSGHAGRIDDLDRFAELGLRTLRYPLLWERLAPTGMPNVDWAWADARMARLRSLGIEPIIGLVHHGSGIHGTSILDESFIDGLARYARAVAERYPWISWYTPVNEPLTTTRFSTLYRHWYPHVDDDRSFTRALLIQVRAIVAAMQAIREVRPDAKLLQTDDVGRTLGTPCLQYQIDLENERRWLTFDLLCGRFDESHPLYEYLVSFGADRRELDWIRENVVPPDLLGANYYITSERFIDHRVERYPVPTRGGNRIDRYADVESARVCVDAPVGLRELLNEAWRRYRRPLAVTEAHLACTREEQMRWLADIWRNAQAARADGVDVRAVTAWALLGAFNWDSLVTRDAGTYEPGAFDVRSRVEPRPTAVAGLVRELAAGRVSEHPALSSAGWWCRPERLLYPPVVNGHDVDASTIAPADRPAGRPILIVGSGRFAEALTLVCRARALSYKRLPRTSPAAVSRAIEATDAWAVMLVRRARTSRHRAVITRRDAVVVGRCTSASEATAEHHQRAAHVLFDLVIDEALGTWELVNPPVSRRSRLTRRARPAVPR